MMSWRRLLVLPVLAILSSGTAANAGLITFEDLAEPGAGFVNVGPTYRANEFVVTSSLGGFLSAQSDNSNFFTGSTGLLQINANSTTELSLTNGGSFRMSSIDLSEWQRNGVNGPVNVTFVGTRPDLTTISEMVTLDGSFGLETFVFNNFRDVISVRWSTPQTSQHQFDNVSAERLSITPEPPSILLIGIGFVMFAGYGFWRNRRNTLRQ